MPIRDLLNAAEESRKTDPVFFWEQAEQNLMTALVKELVTALMQNGLYTEAERETLVHIMAGLTDHPAVVAPAIENARDRLHAKAALSKDLADACAHVLDFIEHKREYVDAKRKEQSGLAAEVDGLMRKLRAFGVCC